MKLKDRVFIFGCGGHAKVVFEILQEMASFEILGFVDERPETGATFLGLPVVSEAEVNLEDSKAFVAVGCNWRRRMIVETILKAWPNLKFVTAIHPFASVSKSAKVGHGTAVMAGAVVNAYAELGSHCVVNTLASVDHDCRLANFVSVGPGASVGGKTEIGECSVLALGVKVIHERVIGSHSVVGAGSLVVRNVRDQVVAYGVPCKEVRTRDWNSPYL